MLDLKLRKFGNSLGTIWPKELLHDLNIGEGDQIFLTKTPDGSYRITTCNPEQEEQLKMARDIMKRYRNTLSELAK